jgi:hypothetical protein
MVLLCPKTPSAPSPRTAAYLNSHADVIIDTFLIIWHDGLALAHIVRDELAQGHQLGKALRGQGAQQLLTLPLALRVCTQKRTQRGMQRNMWEDCTEEMQGDRAQGAKQLLTHTLTLTGSAQ